MNVSAQGLLVLDEYTQLVRHVLGLNPGPGPRNVEVWRPDTETWSQQLISRPVHLPLHHSLVLVRADANGRIRGAGNPIAHLQSESYEEWMRVEFDNHLQACAATVSSLVDGHRVERG